MIFRQYLKVLSAEKTETRRCVQLHESALDRDNRVFKVLTANGRQKWLVGNELPVIPKRAASQVGRVILHSIRCESLQAITEAGAIAEGVASKAEYKELWESINGKYPGLRWDDNPMVWVLSFSPKPTPAQLNFNFPVGDGTPCNADGLTFEIGGW